MKRKSLRLIILFLVFNLVGCNFSSPDMPSFYDRAESFYNSSISLLENSIQECQSIYSYSPVGSYRIEMIENNTVQITHCASSAFSDEKSYAFNKVLSELFTESPFVLVWFDYKCVEFHFFVWGETEEKLVYIPSDDPKSLYCPNYEDSRAPEWSFENKNGGIFCRKENRTVFFREIADKYYFVEQTW